MPDPVSIVTRRQAAARIVAEVRTMQGRRLYTSVAYPPEARSRAIDDAREWAARERYPIAYITEGR